MDHLFLGIDGGQTHTAAVLLAADDRVVATASAGPTRVPGQNPLHTWAAALEQVLQPMATYTDEIAAVGIGATGLGHASQLGPALAQIVRRQVPQARVVVDNDAVAAWWGSNRGQDAAILVAGTGAIAYGRCDGRVARSGGFGFLVGDEGSGSWIGLTALRQVLQAADGRDPGDAARLTEAVLQHFAIPHVLDVLRLLYGGPSIPLARIAELSIAVGQLADDGDALAQTIIQDAAHHLTELVLLLLRRLAIASEHPLSLCAVGRTWQCTPLLRAHCQQAVSRAVPAVDWTAPAADAAIGAAWMARATS